MDMDIMRAANGFWPQVPDRQILAMRAAAWPSDGSSAQPGNAPAATPRPLPMLDWPPALFADATRGH
jgi:hypothetical protein